MGCDSTNVIDIVENNNVNPQPRNILLRQYKGLLSEDSTFTDTIIKSWDELNENLRTYIPLKIKKPENGEEALNTKDDILTKAVSFNFDEIYIIAITGINKVNAVEESNGKYIIYHDNKKPDKKSYIALEVKKIENAEIQFSPPKME